jgi:hypothetical protein
MLKCTKRPFEISLTFGLSTEEPDMCSMLMLMNTSPPSKLTSIQFIMKYVYKCEIDEQNCFSECQFLNSKKNSAVNCTHWPWTSP